MIEREGRRREVKEREKREGKGEETVMIIQREGRKKEREGKGKSKYCIDRNGQFTLVAQQLKSVRFSRNVIVLLYIHLSRRVFLGGGCEIYLADVCAASPFSYRLTA